MIKKYVLLASLLIPTTSHAVDAFEFCETYRTTMQAIIDARFLQIPKSELLKQVPKEDPLYLRKAVELAYQLDYVDSPTYQKEISKVFVTEFHKACLTGLLK